MAPGFTNREEAAVDLTDVIPFLAEDKLKKLGGQFEHKGSWGVYVLSDGHPITGQNPVSFAAAAEEPLKLLYPK